MAKVGCPFDGCEFAGSVSSVEGHISGSTSGDHQGEVGRNHREYLTREAERTIGTKEPTEQVAPVASSGSTNPGRQVLIGTMVLVIVVLASTVPDDEEVEVDQRTTMNEEWMV